ncbi:hypothetical protein JOS77_13705 [Chromobacterium haemolyticum]|nr:hypothetical protein JOS77_13705 [Chromobacterium haemolyticum]
MPPLELTELGPAAQAELSAPPPAHPPVPGRAAWRRRWPSALSVGGLLLLWWAASAGGLVSPLFLPALLRWRKGWRIWRSTASWTPACGVTPPPAWAGWAWRYCWPRPPRCRWAC